MSHVSFGTKLLLGVGALILLLCASGAIALESLHTVQNNMEQASGPIARQMELSGILVRANQGAFLGEKTAILNELTDNLQLMNYWRQVEGDEMATMERSIQSLEPLLTTDRGRAALLSITRNFTSWRASLLRVYRLMDDSKTLEAQTLSIQESKPLFEAITRDAEVIRSESVRVMTAASAKGRKAYVTSRNVILFSIFLSLGVGALVVRGVRGATRTLWNMSESLYLGGNTVAKASGQIATASQTLAQNASEQAAAVEQISASMVEMAATTRNNGERSDQATAMIVETVTRVTESQTALADMILSMTGIQDSSRKIGHINKAIDEIAFKTNILALNAAVEAARAGDAGLGFAVVADEVRNLAQAVASSARDADQLIEAAIQNSTLGADKLQRVVAAIGSITDGAEKVKHLVEEVNLATRQQREASAQVSTALQQLALGSQSSAASAEQSAAASRQLTQQSQSVRVLSDELRELVEGR